MVGQVQLNSPAFLTGEEIELRFSEQRETLDLILGGLAKLVDETRALTQNSGFGNKLDHIIEEMAVAKNAHPPGFCDEKTCTAGCHMRLSKVQGELLEFIEHRIPQTKKVLRQAHVAMRSGSILDLPIESLHLFDELGGKSNKTVHSLPESESAQLLRGMFPND